MPELQLDEELSTLLSELARELTGAKRTLAVAESLTGGELAATLASDADAQEWFSGGVVAYQSGVKHRLLGVPPGPVVAPGAAEAMATAALEMFHADFALGVTGVGGPGEQEGQPPGTVYMSTCERGGTPHTTLYQFEGDPLEVIECTVREALKSILERAVGPHAADRS